MTGLPRLVRHAMAHAGTALSAPMHPGRTTRADHPCTAREGSGEPTARGAGGDRWRSIVGRQRWARLLAILSERAGAPRPGVKRARTSGCNTSSSGARGAVGAAQAAPSPSPSEAAGGTCSELLGCQIDLVGPGVVTRHYGRGTPAGRFLSWVDFSRGCCVFAGATLPKKNPYGVFNDRKRSAG